nr:acyl-CoA dehydrogenase family protein [Sneathiella glossodoripedis]
MSFQTSNLEAISDTFSSFLKAHRLEWEKSQTAPRNLFEKAAECGLLGLETPVRFGGLGAPFSDKVALARKLSEHSMAAAFALINSQNVASRLRGSDHARHHEMADEILSATRIGCTALTEPQAGSDFSSITTTATQTADGWIINGSKAGLPTRPMPIQLCYMPKQMPARDGGGSPVSSLMRASPVSRAVKSIGSLAVISSAQANFT